MSHPARECIVTAMDAKDIHLAAAGRNQSLHTVMHSVEQSLPVERTAFEYDSKFKHGTNSIWMMTL